MLSSKNALTPILLSFSIKELTVSFESIDMLLVTPFTRISAVPEFILPSLRLSVFKSELPEALFLVVTFVEKLLLASVLSAILSILTV